MTTLSLLTCEKPEGYLDFIGSDRTKKVRKDLVDLIIPNGGGPETIQRLLTSMMNFMSYTLPNGNGGVRVIVVSQGEFGSHELLKDWAKKYPETIFPIYRDFNKPPPIPYNDGLEYSARKMDPLSEYIMFLDDDMMMLKKGLIELEKEWLLKGFANVASEHCFFGDKKTLGVNGESKDFGMGSFFFRRKLFEEIGYLDELFDFHCSDTDFNRRVRLRGHKIAVVPGTKQHMIHEHQVGTYNYFKGNHQPVINNDWEVFKKKWYHDEHDHTDISLVCTRCLEIAKTQLPLGRKKYMYV